MSLRLKTSDALARGIISKAIAEDIDRAAKKQRQKIVDLANLGNCQLKVASKTSAKELANEIPQRRLYEAICAVLPGVPQWEVAGLVPGRKYRADIFLPPAIVVELDGFAFHKSKAAFQADRLRNNLFTAHGFRVFHAFVGQVMCEEKLGELVSLIASAYHGQLDGLHRE